MGTWGKYPRQHRVSMTNPPGHSRPVQLASGQVVCRAHRSIAVAASGNRKDLRWPAAFNACTLVTKRPTSAGRPRPSPVVQLGITASLLAPRHRQQARWWPPPRARGAAPASPPPPAAGLAPGLLPRLASAGPSSSSCCTAPSGSCGASASWCPSKSMRCEFQGPYSLAQLHHCCPSFTRGCPCTRCSQAHRQAPLPHPLSDAQRLGTWGYNSLGPIAALPCVLLPPLLQPASERGKPLSQRFWVKANLWIAIYSFIGNYVWTHYFYRLLGAAYTFPAHRLNQARERNPPGEALVSSVRATTLLRCVTCPAPDAFCAAARKEQWAMLVALLATSRCRLAAHLSQPRCCCPFAPASMTARPRPACLPPFQGA